MKDNNILAIISILAMFIGASWLGTCAVIRLITWCFGWNFSIQTATGIWLCLWLLGSTFGGSKK